MEIHFFKECLKTVAGYIKEFKIEITLAVVVALAGSLYICLSFGNRYGERLRTDTLNTYKSDAEIETDAENLVDNLYDKTYTLSKDIYLKYQVKNLGDTVGYCEMTTAVAGGNTSGRVNLTVTEVERLKEYPLIKKQYGGAYISLTVKVESLMAEDLLFRINALRCVLMDDSGYEVVDAENSIGGVDNGPKLEECGDRLDCYTWAFGSGGGSGQFVPVKANSVSIQHLMIKRGESKTFRMVFQIPEDILEDDSLSLTNGMVDSQREYSNTGFGIYLNR